MTRYEDYVVRGKAKHGERFSQSGLSQQFVNAYNTGEGISVAFVSSEGEVYEVRRGTVGATTGWRPCFLLMGCKSDHGSCYTLSDRDRIVSMDAWREYKHSQISLWGQTSL